MLPSVRLVSRIATCIYTVSRGVIGLGMLVETIYVATMDRVECVTISPTRNCCLRYFGSAWRVAGFGRVHLEYVVHGNPGGVVGLIHG